MVVKRKKIRGSSKKKGHEPNTLAACSYCPGSKPRTKKLAKKLRDTRSNRNREMSLWRQLGRGK